MRTSFHILLQPERQKQEKSRGVCETLQYALGGNKVEKAMFSFKVKVKVTRSLTLVSFERASLVEYACQYEVSISYGLKVIANVKVDNRQTNKQTNKQTDTDRQDKNNMPPIVRSGGIKIEVQRDIRN